MKTKTLFTICLLLLGTIVLQAQDLKPFKADNGKYGYKDPNGKIIVQPKYDFAYDFSEGLAGVHILGEPIGRGYGKAISSGYINAKGEEVIPLKYTNVYPFQEGLAWVNTGGEFIDTGFSQQFAGGKWGLVDKNGKVIIPPKYDVVKKFSEGMCVVSIGGNRLTGGGLYGFVDKTGKEVIPLEYDKIFAEIEYEGGFKAVEKYFKDGKVKVQKDGRTFFIDKTGKEVK